MPGKLVCPSCLSEATQGQTAPPLDLASVIKQSVRDCMKELSVPDRPSTSTQPQPAIPHAHASSDSEGSEAPREADDMGQSGFDFTLVDPFVQAVKEAIGWVEPAEEPANVRKFFPHLKKATTFLPFMDEIQDIIREEWKKPEKKPSLHNRLSKLYPLRDKDVESLTTPPLVDASVMRLARHVTLPMEDAVSFRDPLERKVDLDLKRAYSAAGGACRPAIALASVSRAILAWTANLERALRSDMDRDRIIAGLQELRLAGDYIAEAAIDVVRSSSRAMLHTVTAKRALWLRPWLADPTSKSNWCKIPFDGSNLFGGKLDSAISKVSGGKSGLLPQDRKPKRPGLFQNRRWAPDRAKESRSYRPGREYRRNWKGTQSSLFKLSKQGPPTGPTSSFDQKKSF